MSFMLRVVLLKDISLCLTPAIADEFAPWAKLLKEPWAVVGVCILLLIVWHCLLRPWTSVTPRETESWVIMRVRVITVSLVVLLVMVAEFVPLKPQNGTDLRPVCQGLLVMAALIGPARVFLAKGIASILLRQNEPTALFALPAISATLFSAVQTFFAETSLLAHVRGAPSLWVLAAFLALFGVLCDALPGERVPVGPILGSVLIASIVTGIYWGLFWESMIKALMTSAATLAVLTPAPIGLMRVRGNWPVLFATVPYVFCGFFIGQEGNIPLWGMHLVWPTLVLGSAYFWIQIRQESASRKAA